MEKMKGLKSSERDNHTPLPRLILVAGKPGAGKSTLAKELSRAENLGLPLLSRDAIKAGMVETWAFVSPEMSRSEIETDALRSTLVPNSFDLFYQTMTGWLQAGVSFIAEYSFDRRSEAVLKPIIENANPVLIQCECPDAIARQRFIEREQTEGRIRPDRLTNIMKRIALGTDPWCQFEAMDLPIPVLRVNTKSGYEPGLDEAAAFCRNPTRSSGSPF